jgi:hypothetical protein
LLCIVHVKYAKKDKEIYKLNKVIYEYKKKHRKEKEQKQISIKKR